MEILYIFHKYSYPVQGSIKVVLIAVGALALGLAVYYFTTTGQSPGPGPTPTSDNISSVAGNESSVETGGNQTGSVRKEVILNMMLTGDRWDALLGSAERRYESRHPDIDLKIISTILLYEESRFGIAESIRNQTSLDMVSLDQIWLGELAEEGLLVDLSDMTKEWGRAPEWYQANWDGGLHNGKVYAIWAWTDVRGMWYWKDMLQQADVDPDSLRTWEGYIESAGKLDSALQGEGVTPVHLVGADHSPDMWYPYLWMLGGDILEHRQGHPSKGAYWFPAYNGTEGIRALEFLKAQVDAGIAPQESHYWGSEFANRSFAVMLEGSWLPGEFPPEMREDLETEIGFLPLFPVPNEGDKSATLMGGWLLAIPETSSSKELAWEFLSTLVEPDVIVTILKQDGYLPTQIPIGEGRYADTMRESLVYYDSMTSMLTKGHVRPNVVEYSEIAGHIRDAINEVYRGEKLPKEALDDAASRSAATLGWQ
jgi:multiple sugar transport system substrate-binding protein